MFRYYIAIVKSLNFDIKTLFNKEQRRALKIPY